MQPSNLRAVTLQVPCIIKNVQIMNNLLIFWLSSENISSTWRLYFPLVFSLKLPRTKQNTEYMIHNIFYVLCLPNSQFLVMIYLITKLMTIFTTPQYPTNESIMYYTCVNTCRSWKSIKKVLNARISVNFKLINNHCNNYYFLETLPIIFTYQVSKKIDFIFSIWWFSKMTSD